MGRAMGRAVLKAIALSVTAVMFGVTACILYGKPSWAIFLSGLIPGMLVSAVMYLISGDEH